jgi:16S rRNA (guanine1516-N2)-methyltransferase
MLVTTSYKPSPETVEQSRRIAQELGCRWVPRGGLSIRKLMNRYGMQPVLLQTDEGLKLYANADDAPMFFHPSMSFIRAKRLLNGEGDAMIEASGAEKGDRVLDCTAGLATDSIVFSFVVGPEGRVTAVESQAPVYILIREGLSRYVTHLDAFNEAMRRIEVRHAGHLDVLRSMDDNSVDIVYFDPMFRQPIDDSSAIQPLRHVANPDPLSIEAVEQAKRVARKSVVLKEHRDGGEFDRLGFTRIFRPGTKIAYGVIHP